jgi:putative endopeptidase
MLSLALLLNAALFAAEPMRFSPADIDKTADPCVDFYQYSCGGWLKSHEIPPSEAWWGAINELRDRNKQTLREILEKASAADARREALDQKIGDDYAACMDEAGAETLGASPLKPELDRVAALTRETLPEELARLHSSGVSAAFELSPAQDFRDASRVIAWADQGGLGLPERDYYFKTDEKSVKLRNDYERHVTRMFELSGDSPKTAAAEAAAAIEFEVKLASASQDVVFRRVPANLDHRMTRAQLVALAPDFRWDNYFALAGAPTFSVLNAAAPDFLRQAAVMARSEPLSRWKSYLRWRVVSARAPLLSKAFVDESFAFYGKTLTGAKELKPRWKRCVERTDAHLGEALGRRYVERTFGSEGKTRMLAMVAALRGALQDDLRTVDWMGESTKKRALAKLASMTAKIGYPDRWRDYSALEIKRGDAVGNAARAEAFEWRRQLAKIGKPVDRGEWHMSPPTVNAYYDQQVNDINFPAGILQPPLFDRGMDDAVNYGAIGAVIGHEMTHGFDDEGRHYDAKGNLADWWTPKDGAEFDKRAQCFVDEYSSFTAVGDLKVNGRLTLGENTADNGGVRIAYAALQRALKGGKPAPVDGYTPEQRFFLGWGQAWCSRFRDDFLRMMALTNPHPPYHLRPTGVVVNMPEFAKAFSCKPGQPMVGAKPCRVW